ncbi:mitochondrial import receptor subunit tom-20 [Amylocarpus encephaloides]|uniref:Mitochondrial import receptor subunit TOM20 n=1 Tax=Amylocarpus encephaloides TaxID=45428 RepID=A0A9P8C8F7_9HELO|nr:mitochondrial import receptor subunit tom-20 [Amylocarpus encephaloides]
MPNTSTLVATTVGTVATGFLVGLTYLSAIYFDHRRRTDPNFRKQLKKESKRQARAAKDEAQAQATKQREQVKMAVKDVKDEGFPLDVEEKEAYFMTEVARGEQLSMDGSDNLEAALCFYKALKVYPQPPDLISIYDKTVAKPVLDLLAEMIAADDDLDIGSFRGGGSDSGIPSERLD